MVSWPYSVHVKNFYIIILCTSSEIWKTFPFITINTPWEGTEPDLLLNPVLQCGTMWNQEYSLFQIDILEFCHWKTWQLMDFSIGEGPEYRPFSYIKQLWDFFTF
jgi:hypothetical protein